MFLSQKSSGKYVTCGDYFAKYNKPTCCAPSVQFSSVAQSCPTLCDPMNHSTPGLPVQLSLSPTPGVQ